MVTEQSIEIGKRLKSHLRKTEVSLVGLAEKLGVTPQYVYSVLSGKQLGRKAAERWGEILGIRSGWLLTGDGNIELGEEENQEGSSFSSVEGYLKIIEKQENQIIELAKTIGRLEAQIEMLRA